MAALNFSITRFFAIAAAIMLLSSVSLAFQETGSTENDTPVEYVVDPPRPPKELATIFYQPSDQEKLYFQKLAPDEIKTGGLAGDYDLASHDTKYVGWFGIIREIDIDEEAHTTRLLVEHKYFDGMTDAHIQALSFNGSGDFEAILTGANHSFGVLELVKVYGVATTKGPNGLPRVNVQFVRDWSWGTFTFIMAAGLQRGSEKWRKLNTVPLDDIYESLPDEDYYVKRLGPTPSIAKINEIKEFALKAAERLGVDPKSLPDEPEKYTELIGKGEFEKRALDAALKLKPDAQPFVESIISLIVQANYDELDDSIDRALAANMHDAVAAVLISALVLDDQDDTAATHRLGDLSFSAGKCIPALIEALQCNDGWSRSQAADVLGDIGSTAEPAIPALIFALMDGDGRLRPQAAESLGEIRKCADAVIPALIILLDDADWYVRFQAVQAIGNFEQDAASVAPELVKIAVNDKDVNVRFLGAEALGRTGNGSVAIPALRSLLSDSNEDVRRFSAIGISKFGQAANDAIPQLKKLLNDASLKVKIAAAEALWQFERNTQDTLPILDSALRHGGFPAYWAADASASFGAEAKPLLPELIKLSHDDWWQSRSSAAKAMAEIGAEDALPRLRELMEDETSEVRAYAAAAIWRIEGNADSIQFLIHELQNDDSAKSGAIRAIGMIGNSANEAIPLVEKCLTSQNQFEREYARETLVKLKANSP